jgi:hypothetical protein
MLSFAPHVQAQIKLNDSHGTLLEDNRWYGAKIEWYYSWCSSRKGVLRR